MEGDCGGQTYVAAPAKLVSCDEKILGQLLQDLDELAWHNTAGQQLTNQKHQVGKHLRRRNGWAEATGDVWVHQKLRELGIENRIRKVISGEEPRSGLPVEAANRKREARRIQVAARKGTIS